MSQWSACYPSVTTSCSILYCILYLVFSLQSLWRCERGLRLLTCVKINECSHFSLIYSALYEDWAFVLDEERASMLPTMAAGDITIRYLPFASVS